MRGNALKSALLALAIIFIPALAMSQATINVSGTVKQATDSAPVPWATVVAMNADSTVVGAAVAGEDGLYAMDIAPGRYIFAISCIGYDPAGREAECGGRTAKLDFTLSPSATDIEEVKVRAPKITREADRFVMSVAGTLDAVGKNAEEFLKTAPAVWIKDDRILIEGRAGAQIMVDERILNMNDEQAIVYLRSINAEDIARIEIIPRAGADYDASASGGVIKITLRKKRDAGIEISPSYRMSFGKNQNSFRPNITVNYRTGKLAFYTHLYNDHFKRYAYLEEHNVSAALTSQSQTTLKGKNHNGGGRFGVIYDINEKQSIGAEYAFYSDNESNHNNPFTSIYAPDLVSTDSSRYRQDQGRRNNYAALNYILRLDSLGSVFKVIGDVSFTNTDGDNMFRNRHTYHQGPQAGGYRDTLYRNDVKDRYTVATGTASLEKVFSYQSRLSTGVKFVYTSLDDDSRYYGERKGDWELDRRYSLEQKYTEKIAALYAMFNSSMGPVRYSLGLRGEYTHATPVTSLFDGTPTEKNKNTYFSLFPNVNLSVPLNQDKGHSISAFYARKINRPGYWALNPFRMQVSEYSYIIGDPMLKPTYIDETGLSLTFFHKLSLTAGHAWMSDRVEQYVYIDPQNPDITIYQHSNLANTKKAYVSLSAPVDITDKITLNTNVVYGNSRMDPGNGGARIAYNNLFANASLSFTLPRTYRLEISGWYTTGDRWGNMIVKSMGDMNIAVRKRYFDDKLAVAVEVSNILQYKNHQRFTVKEEGFTRTMRQYMSSDNRSVMMSLQYNFKAGKKANGRHVERGGDDSR